jgi:hypothetical protein
VNLVNDSKWMKHDARFLSAVVRKPVKAGVKSRGRPRVSVIRMKPVPLVRPQLVVQKPGQVTSFGNCRAPSPWPDPPPRRVAEPAARGGGSRQQVW